MTIAPPTDAEERALGTLGLAFRAGRAVAGSRASREAAREGELRALLVARDATENALGRLRSAIAAEGVRACWCSDRASLGEALGRSPLVAVGITDRGLAEKITGGLAPIEDEERERVSREGLNP